MQAPRRSSVTSSSYLWRLALMRPSVPLEPSRTTADRRRRARSGTEWPGGPACHSCCTDARNGTGVAASAATPQRMRHSSARKRSRSRAGAAAADPRTRLHPARACSARPAHPPRPQREDRRNDCPTASSRSQSRWWDGGLRSRRRAPPSSTDGLTPTARTNARYQHCPPMRLSTSASQPAAR